MRIAAYVVSDPSSKEEIIHEILCAIAEARLARLTLTSVDLLPEEERKVEFGVRQVDVGDLHFIGIFYEGTSEMLINLFIPRWDEEPTVKISPFHFPDPA